MPTIDELKALLQDMILPLKEDVSEIKDMVKKDHDVVIAHKIQVAENSKNIDILRGRLWKVASAMTVLCGFGFAVGKYMS